MMEGQPAVLGVNLEVDGQPRAVLLQTEGPRLFLLCLVQGPS